MTVTNHQTDNFLLLKQCAIDNGLTHTELNVKLDLSSLHNKSPSECEAIVQNYRFNPKCFFYFIPSVGNLGIKHRLWIALVTTHNHELAERIMPKTYVLDYGQDIEKLTSHYQPGNWYILKRNLQRREGIQLFTQLDAILTAHRASDRFPFTLAQEYVKNAYLVKGHKINLRLYTLLVYQNREWMMYLYQEGLCHYTNLPYELPATQVVDEINIEAHITQTHEKRDLSLYEKLPYLLSDFLRNLGADAKNFWEKTVKNIQDCGLSYFKLLKCPASLTEQPMVNLFGLDIMIDDTLHPYVLEWNLAPGMLASDDVEQKLKYGVWRDMCVLLNIFPQKEPSRWQPIIKCNLN